MLLKQEEMKLDQEDILVQELVELQELMVLVE